MPDPILPLPIAPLPEVMVPRPLRELRREARRIDGWGPIAWRETHGWWRLPGGLLGIEPSLSVIERGDGDELSVTLVSDALPREPWRNREPVAWCDWCWRQAVAAVGDLPERQRDRLRLAAPTAAVRATTSATLWQDPAGNDRLVLRLGLRPPYAGMGCDGQRFLALVAVLQTMLAQATDPRRAKARASHARAVAVQRALRERLDEFGLCAFIGCGALIARDGQVLGGADRPDPRCRPFDPADQAMTIDLGRLGKISGLGLRHGVTALIGAPYHGKSTLLQALAAGAEDHPPGDGRELVVTHRDSVVIQAEDGRLVHSTDLSAVFARLPGANPMRFTTRRASGATSMAAGALQAAAAGCRMLLIDEDSAANNALAIDPGMRQLLGSDLDGTTTLVELLPALAAQGCACVLAVGSASGILAHCDRVLRVRDFQVSDATTAARKVVPRASLRELTAPRRHLSGDPEALFRQRHVLDLDLDEPERPRIDGTYLDLRRAGFLLDPALARGALIAAALCCRLANGGCDLRELRQRWLAFAAERGATGLDPWHREPVTLPPWMLVAAVLERLPRVVLG
ncbi:hypothetical protein LBMAG53_13410 [Planctomycetota bacterium]|nr:hypothetical protein LBMAG53_13410 [Planctomycetota bacterium]